MPSPRLPGSGIEKILISSHEIPEDQIFNFVVFPCCCPKPGVGLFSGHLWFLFFLDGSSPGLPLSALRAPLLFPTGCPTIPSKVSHFITVVTLHLGGVPASFPLSSMVSISWREGGFLVLLVPRRRFVVSQCKSSLYSRSCRCVHCVWIRYGWTWRCEEFAQVVQFGRPRLKSLENVMSLFDGLPLFLSFDGRLLPSFVRLRVIELVNSFI